MGSKGPVIIQFYLEHPSAQREWCKLSYSSWFSCIHFQELFLWAFISLIPKYLSGFRSKLPVLQRDFFLNMCHKPISKSANCVFLSDFHGLHLSKSSLLHITIYLYDVCVSSIFSTGHRHIFQGYMDDNNKSLDFLNFNLLDVFFIFWKLYYKPIVYNILCIALRKPDMLTAIFMSLKKPWLRSPLPALVQGPLPHIPTICPDVAISYTLSSLQFVLFS